MRPQLGLPDGDAELQQQRLRCLVDATNVRRLDEPAVGVGLFTPRIANVARLTKTGRMQPAGFAEVEAAKADGRWAKAYRMAKSEAPQDLLAAFEASPKARAMYATLSAQNRFSLTFRTNALKTEKARKKKIRAFVEMLERGETIHPNGKGKPRPASASRKR